MSRMMLGETQEDLATAMRDYFSRDDYTVEIESNGMRILQRLRQDDVYQVIVLEVALPGLDGINIVRDYRAGGGTTPIVLLAVRHCSEQFCSGLDAGADAFMIKPFHLMDLAAQLRAVMRRPTLRNDRMLTLGGIELNSHGGTVTKNDIAVHLHPMEFKLLEFLMTNPNQVFTAHALFERVWQKDFGLLEDTVRTHVRTIRQKLDSKGSASIITTVRGLGYKTENR